MAHDIDGVTRRKVLLNSDPEPTETLLALEAFAVGLVYLLGNFVGAYCVGGTSPVAAGLITTLGQGGLSLVGGLLLALGFVQLGAVYHDLLWTRRGILVIEVGWWLFVAVTYAAVMGFVLGPLLFTVFSGKSAWSLWRLFQAGVTTDGAPR